MNSGKKKQIEKNISESNLIHDPSDDENDESVID